MALAGYAEADHYSNGAAGDATYADRKDANEQKVCTRGGVQGVKEDSNAQITNRARNVYSPVTPQAEEIQRRSTAGTPTHQRAQRSRTAR
jgi:hypothetical protein